MENAVNDIVTHRKTSPHAEMKIERADLTLALTFRERDTILAALRFWQRRDNIRGSNYSPEYVLAQGDRNPMAKDAVLGDAEINALIQSRLKH